MEENKIMAAAQIVSSILQREDIIVFVKVSNGTNEVILGVRDYKELADQKVEISLKDLIKSVKQSL